ncbi:hypothetical protein [Acinetobacter tibetensis]|jgi:predicted nucleic acid-binding protein|uniref:Lipoprotein n=1 Tax=Acinetobacter tibetensis TaxID=2943497 RepID=A0AAE9LQH8_9GAMM|nr:hypothetical protein [Acinetobacter tibetensis]USE82783.1 hypothetical protein M5E07_13510 [Acinetobacter tibetensis]
MLKKTLLVVMCGFSLVACGGGGGGSSSSTPTTGGTTDNGSTTTPVSDLDKAKKLIQTTNSIVAYYDGFQDISEQYKVPAQVINETASDLSRATGLLLAIAEVVAEDAQGQTKSYTTQQIQDLIEANSADYKFVSNTLTAKVAGETITISGNAKLQYWQGYDWDKVTADQAWSKVEAWFNDPTYSIYADEAEVTASNLTLVAPFVDTPRTTYNFKIQKDGKISVKNQNNQTASFSATAESTASIVYASNDTIENREDIPAKATISLKGIMLESAGAQFALTELTSIAQKVTFKSGVETVEQLLPLELTLKGTVTYLQESLNLDATIKLNNDFSKPIDVSLGETATNFINANLAVKLSGKLKGANAAPTPFNLDISAKRAEFVQGTATVTLKVDQNALSIDLIARNLDQEQKIMDATIRHANGAFVQVNDIQNFKSAAVQVGNSSYGTVTKNSSGQYVAKFTDNSFIYITP